MKSASWKLTWGDEFTGSGPLNSKIWSTLTTTRTAKFPCSDTLPQNAYRQGGAAVLKVSRLAGDAGKVTKKCPTGQVGNAMVQADNPAQRMQYGFAAARVKWAPLGGMHSAFWLDSPSDAPAMTAAAPRVEIDIAEYFGDGRSKGGLATFVHSMTPKGIKSVGGEFQSRQLLPKKKEWSQGWHVYSVEWSPTGYIFRVDGVITLKTAKNVSHSPKRLLLSSLTSSWEIPKLKIGKLPTVTKFDWVHVWENPKA